MNQIELFNHWFARMTSKYLAKKPQKGYTAEIDVSDLIKGETSGIYKESQKNKPSPSSHLSYDDCIALFNWRNLSRKDVTRSYIGWTNSMEPTFDFGDMCFKTPYSTYKKEIGELRLGQVAIYQYGGSRIIHRFIGKTSGGKFIFKGDNNFRADPPVSEDDIIDVCVGIFHTKDKIAENQD